MHKGLGQMQATRVVRAQAGADKREAASVVAFVLFPNFSLLSFASAIEPLRVANLLSEEPIYRHVLVSKNKAAVTSSSGIAITGELDFNFLPKCDLLVLCAGYGGEYIDDDALYAWLRRLVLQGTQLAGVGTGTYLLARAGLLDGRRCTVHWENITSFSEEFRNVEVTDDVYVNDGPFWTSCGGAASIDMMLGIIATRHGAKLSKGIADQFVCSTIRTSTDKQLSNAERFGVVNAELSALISLMEANLEEPIALASLARRTGTSVRQIQRLFRTSLRKSPGQYYLEIRLDRAKALVIQTNMSISEIAMSCGFSSASHFSAAYKRFYRISPLHDRQAMQASTDRGYYISSGMQRQRANVDKFSAPIER